MRTIKICKNVNIEDEEVLQMVSKILKSGYGTGKHETFYGDVDVSIVRNEEDIRLYFYKNET